MKNIFLAILVAGCSTMSQKPQLSENSINVPDWVYSPYEFCSEQTQLCASGEGRTMNEADSIARNNIATIFEVKLKSDLNIVTTSEQTMPFSGAVREDVQKTLQESTDQVLETVQIIKHFKDKSLHYSLASLDKAKISDFLGSRILKIDSELEILWSRRSRTNLRKILKLYHEREKLHDRYLIVSAFPMPSKLSYRDIIDWRQTKPKLETLALRIGQAPDWLSGKLVELLSESGFKIVKGDAEKAVSVNVDSIKEFLNVEGFEKHTFTLNLMSFDKGEKKRVISFSETVTGRNQTDALLKVKHLFNEYIEQHLSDLDLD